MKGRISTLLIALTLVNLTTTGSLERSNTAHARSIQNRSIKNDKCNEQNNNCKEEVVKAQEIVYPFSIDKSAILDLGTGATYPSQISSEAPGDEVFIQYAVSKKEELKTRSIKNEYIVSWSVGDYTEQKFSFANAASGTLGFAAGALLIPSPATPLLLLMSPLMGGLSGASSVDPKWRVALQMLNKSGREETVLVQFFSEKDTLSFSNVISKETGLQAGVRKSNSEMSTIKKMILLDLVSRRRMAAKSLTTYNGKKPWCADLDFSLSADHATDYKNLTDDINTLLPQISTNVDIDMDDENTMLSREEKWKAHLLKKPNLKIWADANVEAAKKFKECPIGLANAIN